MATSVYTKYTAGVESLLEGTNSGTDVWKVALAATINIADTAFTPGTSDLPTAGGYTAGGNTCATTSSSQTAGTYKLVLANPATWTASGAGFTFRYAILYDYTTGVPFGYWDYGSSVVMSGANADTFTVNLDAVNGVFSVA
jgi:hypothetical protein